MERCRACGAPVEHSAPDGDLKYYPAAASRSGPRHERERIIAALRSPPEDLQNLMADALLDGHAQEGPGHAGAVALYVAGAAADWIAREFATKAT